MTDGIGPEPVTSIGYGARMIDKMSARSLLADLAGPDAVFRAGQEEAIGALVGDRRRVLVVQRTGWGKSAVYLIAAKLLRASGAGPTVIVSPLIALMRNQLEMAERLDLTAATINTLNRDDWDRVFGLIESDAIDLLLISPERLNNPRFREEALSRLMASVGLLVVDEVHCISDWGHDFRPDYRRLGAVVRSLPPNMPVLGTTATANDRVVRDVEEQLGDDLMTIRGPLERESLALQVNRLPQYADRLAWLAGAIPTLSGSGIVYCLTIRDARRVAKWLSDQGIDAVSYTGQDEAEERLRVEQLLNSGDVKVVVATSALGMGYDNPRIEFVVHFQSPGSPIAYYQQVGRAGRAVDRSYGVLLAGSEDEEIQDYFIGVAFPSEVHTRAILDALGFSEAGLRLVDLEGVVNLQRSRIVGLMKILEVEGAAYRDGSSWFRSPRPFSYPGERVAAVTEERRAEQAAMADYLKTHECLMQTLRSHLDDRDPQRCGRCANCLGRPVVDVQIDPNLVARAQRFVERGWIPILPRLQWFGVSGRPSLKEYGLAEGRALCKWGDTGWAQQVKKGKQQLGVFSDALVLATAEMLREWHPNPQPQWLTHVPTVGGGGLVADLAERLGVELGLPVLPVVSKTRETKPQKAMENSVQRVRNVSDAFRIEASVEGVGILLDDMVDSRWTLTEVGVALRKAGAEAIYPVALADTAGANDT